MLERIPSRDYPFRIGKDWPVPDLQDIKPGLVIEVGGPAATNGLITYEISGLPYLEDNGNWWVRAKFAGQERDISLADIGITEYYNAPFPDSWNRSNFPLTWHTKEIE